jgi:hypothetical protein
MIFSIQICLIALSVIRSAAEDSLDVFYTNSINYLYIDRWGVPEYRS